MGALSWGLDLANFEGVPVRLHGFEMENVSMMWSAFVAQVFRQVRVSLTTYRRLRGGGCTIAGDLTFGFMSTKSLD